MWGGQMWPYTWGVAVSRRMGVPERMGLLPYGGLQAQWEGQSGTLQEEDGVVYPTQPSPSLQGCTYSTPYPHVPSPTATFSLVPASHIGPPLGSEPTVLHHRLWLLHLHFIFHFVQQNILFRCVF